MPGKESLPVLLAICGGPRRFRGSVFEDQLALREVPAESNARPEEDQRRVGRASVENQFRVGERFDITPGELAIIATLLRPSLAKGADRRG